MDWTDWVPFLGPQWVHCDAKGHLVSKYTHWERRVICLSWFGWAVVFYQWPDWQRTRRCN